MPNLSGETSTVALLEGVCHVTEPSQSQKNLYVFNIISDTPPIE